MGKNKHLKWDDEVKSHHISDDSTHTRFRLEVIKTVSWTFFLKFSIVLHKKDVFRVWRFRKVVYQNERKIYQSKNELKASSTLLMSSKIDVGQNKCRGLQNGKMSSCPRVCKNWNGMCVLCTLNIPTLALMYSSLH